MQTQRYQYMHVMYLTSWINNTTLDNGHVFHYCQGCIIQSPVIHLSTLRQTKPFALRYLANWTNHLVGRNLVSVCLVCVLLIDFQILCVCKHKQRQTDANQVFDSWEHYYCHKNTDIILAECRKISSFIGHNCTC